MNTNALDRRNALCDVARAYHRTKFYVPSTDEYLEGFVSRPVAGFLSYEDRQVEPIVDPRHIYDLPSEARLTVNGYNALVLNSSNMLIADVDFGDARLNRFAGAMDCEDVLRNLEDLHLLDDERFRIDDFRFADQSYHVYRTHSGCRVICTSMTFPWDSMGWQAERFMRFLRSDPQYIALCDIQKCFRARLTPKPWRASNGDPAHVCNFEAKIGNRTVAEELREQLTLHDELTLCHIERDWSHLA